MRFFFILFLFSSCITAKKATKYLDKNPSFSSDYFLRRFPIVNDTIITYVVDSTLDSVYNELLDYTIGLASEKLDLQKNSIAESVKVDTVKVIQRNNVLRKTPCIEVRTITRTYENTARVDSLRRKMEVLNAELQDYSVKVNNRNKILTSLGSLLIGLVSIYLRGRSNNPK